MDGYLTILSFGAGQDSTAILYKLLFDKAFREKYAPNDLAVVFADTGNEHRHTYEHIDFVGVLCEQHKIPFFVLGEEYQSQAWRGGLVAHYERYNVIISRAMARKSCTDSLKIQPIYKWLARYVNDNYLFGLSQPKRKISLIDFATRFGKINVLIGIAADEAKSRINSNPAFEKGYMAKAIRKVYPLVEENWDRNDCQGIIGSYAMPFVFPSNCMFCPFMSEIELIWLYRFHNPAYNHFVRLEKNKLTVHAQRERNMGVFGVKTIEEVLQKALTKHGHLSDEQIIEYKKSHGHCVKSKY